MDIAASAAGGAISEAGIDAKVATVSMARALNRGLLKIPNARLGSKSIQSVLLIISRFSSCYTTQWTRRPIPGGTKILGEESTH
jgi:hypothetical protein